MSEMRLHDAAGRRLYLDAEERTAFLAAARRQPAQDRTLCEALHWAGCRPSERLQAFMTSGWGWSDEELASIEAPTLIVLGDNDFIPVEHAARTAEVIGAQLAVLPDTTHLSIMRRADWLAPLIENRIATTAE